MTYPEAIQYLFGLRKFGFKPGLEQMLELADLAGHPEKALRFIHVAGTNGKGSTCAMLESIYREAGLKVGLYTSPHLISFGERIQVNRQILGESETLGLLEQVQTLIRSLKGNQHPTFFEIATMMALLHFRAQDCDLVIWETGLGGRWDATNIVTPMASVITTIDYDHEKWLGSTLEQIAFEKSGIIKPGAPVITGVQHAGSLQVVCERATQLNSHVRRINDLDLHRARSIQPGLKGSHQCFNGALALATVEVLQSTIPVSSPAIRDGLQKVCWPGRFQELQVENRRLILDGAHNLQGVRVLSALIRETYPSLEVIVLGILEDKDWREMCSMLAPLASNILTVPVHSTRSCDPVQLAEECHKHHSAARIHPCASLAAALRESASHSSTLICGSLYLVGEALELLSPGSISQSERGLNEWAPPPP